MTPVIRTTATYAVIRGFGDETKRDRGHPPTTPAPGVQGSAGGRSGSGRVAAELPRQAQRDRAGLGPRRPAGRLRGGQIAGRAARRFYRPQARCARPRGARVRSAGKWWPTRGQRRCPARPADQPGTVAGDRRAGGTRTDPSGGRLPRWAATAGRHRQDSDRGRRRTCDRVINARRRAGVAGIRSGRDRHRGSGCPGVHLPGVRRDRRGRGVRINADAVSGGRRIVLGLHPGHRFRGARTAGPTHHRTSPGFGRTGT